MPAEGPSGIGSCITFHGSTSWARRTPSRTLKRRSRLMMRSPTRSISSTVTSQPVTARTILTYGSPTKRPKPRSEVNRHRTSESPTAVKCWLRTANAGLSFVPRRSNPCAYCGVGRVS
ncbi:MAG: hypothetical protein DME07_10590 [Candidatus Rokuibacteriota bacterium]|nr:MAG: hypothetical protein DME07_10590 [Candidatus Rokubacteria bacterium]PYN57164.1 MAG: hypothetical protein DMD94_05165 [Candidatus Rokubacteria bacterium]PYN76782.1 MAG: hypothetical protein DMD97_11180 [Candidatus Rokubacteria bacterium]